MTAIVAAVGLREPLARGEARRILAAAGARAGERVDIESGEGFMLATATPLDGPGAGCRLAADERFVVAADATLYYLADLQRATGIPVTSGLTCDSPGQLLLRACRTFAARCVERVEGDYAFAAWDRVEQKLFCARDFTGRRPLYHAPYRGGVVVASSIACFAQLPGFDAVPDIGTVGADAGGLFFAVDDETCIRGVSALGAGCTMTWRAARSLRVERAWDPRVAESDVVPFDDAAVHLRSLLQAATLERVECDRPTAVWMSGGRDSTAVFACGMHGMRTHRREPSIFPVSRSHPAGDIEREDEAVLDVARFWDVDVSWVDVKQVPMFPAAASSQRIAVDSFQQPFQELTRALARAARAGGATVVLDGHGGDFLFQVSRAYLGDLVAKGNVAGAWHDWRTMDRGREGVRGFIRDAVQPAIPGWALRMAGIALGRRLHGAMERVAPPWIDRRFLATHDIEARQRALGPDAPRGRTASEREMRFCLTHPFFARVNAAMAEHALEHGVELRSPILDRRIVDFALTRPRVERNRAGDQKRLLRAAVAGLLPPAVLAPRSRKQGTLATYFAYHMTSAGLSALRRTFPAVALADHGVVDLRTLSKAVERFAAEGPAYPHVEALYCTLQAERWLREQRSSTAWHPLRAAAHPGYPELPLSRGEAAPHLHRAGSPATLLETE